MLGDRIWEYVNCEGDKKLEYAYVSIERVKSELKQLQEKANRVEELKLEVEDAWKEEKKWRNKVQEYSLKNRSLEQDALLGKALKHFASGPYHSIDICILKDDGEVYKSLWFNSLIEWYQQQLEKEETSGK